MSDLYIIDVVMCQYAFSDKKMSNDHYEEILDFILDLEEDAQKRLSAQTLNDSASAQTLNDAGSKRKSSSSTKASNLGK